METDNIILEHLRAIRADIAVIKNGVRELRDEFIATRLREHARDSDLVTHTQQIARLEVDVERIKRRLELVED
jgi:hypothetical protein